MDDDPDRPTTVGGHGDTIMSSRHPPETTVAAPAALHYHAVNTEERGGRRMGTPAAVLGDQVTGQCPLHFIPNPATGAPQPSPPLPFSAPLLEQTVATVLICGKPAAVMGSSGFCTPPHVGLHPADPFMAPPAQTGQVVVGSATVLIAGQPAASQASQCMSCGGMPATLMASGATVLIGE